ncbi:hypothetical protein EI94DRAFT_560632 [Lactarius quietus]|nr:hypothetical protein EI94DRAFT_560632 [Lactarius quietus]
MRSRSSLFLLPLAFVTRISKLEAVRQELQRLLHVVHRTTSWSTFLERKGKPCLSCTFLRTRLSGPLAPAHHYNGDLLFIRVVVASAIASHCLYSGLHVGN